MAYVGRFAPSPTGPLHAGSVATALASYLHARQHDGRWLLRIDDLDPPRCVSGSAQSIIELLERLQLHWDGTVYLQSERRREHAAAAAGLLKRGAAFRCECTRSELLRSAKTGPLGIRYDGRCRNRGITRSDSAIRVRVDTAAVVFDDLLQGRQSRDLRAVCGDYIVYRRDALPAYHLAAVLDDFDQGITDVVRGSDLLAATSIHVHLAGVLGLPQPRYRHLPVLCDARGEKLSKRHAAAAVAELPAPAIAWSALRNIGAAPPRELHGAAPESLWEWARQHWRIEQLSGQLRRPAERS